MFLRRKRSTACDFRRGDEVQVFGLGAVGEGKSRSVCASRFRPEKRVFAVGRAARGRERGQPGRTPFFRGEAGAPSVVTLFVRSSRYACYSH